MPLLRARHRTSQLTLRISTTQTEASIAITLEGRVAGPWAEELSRTWEETKPSIGSRKLLLDLRNTTYADAPGIRILREIYSQSSPEIVTSSPWTQYLAEQISSSNETTTDSDPQ